MQPSASPVPRRYETSLDRAGLALGVGSLIAGAFGSGLQAMGGHTGVANLAIGWLVGSLLAALAITAVIGPLWLVLHVAGLRRLRYAVLAGALMAMLLLVGGQTYGFGLFDRPAMDDRTWLFHWLGAVATSVLPSMLAAGIAALMWRIAYRRIA